MTWLDEAKKRVEDANTPCDRISAEFDRRQTLRMDICEDDAPRMIALLERAKREIERLRDLTIDGRANAWLRDLEKGVAATPQEGGEDA